MSLSSLMRMTFEPKTLDLADLLDRKLLAGAPAGEEDRARIAAAIPARTPLVVIGFASVTALTPSYFTKGLAPLWTEHATAIGATGLSRIRDDLRVCLGWHELAVWDLDSEPTALGHLDTSATRTLHLCLQHRQVTAGFLTQQQPSVRPTAWSNRLSRLYAKRLLNRRQSGRQTLYYLPWHSGEGDEDGS